MCDKCSMLVVPDHHTRAMLALLMVTECGPRMPPDVLDCAVHTFLVTGTLNDLPPSLRTVALPFAEDRSS
jgi:hypothetical protein